VRVERHGPLPGRKVLGEDLYPYLDRAASDRLDLGSEHRDLPHLDRMEEVDVVHGAEQALAAGDSGGGHVPHGGNPLHHASAVDLPWRPRVLGEHPLDHLGDGIVDR